MGAAGAVVVQGWARLRSIKTLYLSKSDHPVDFPVRAVQKSRYASHL